MTTPKFGYTPIQKESYVEAHGAVLLTDDGAGAMLPIGVPGNPIVVIDNGAVQDASSKYSFFYKSLVALGNISVGDSLRQELVKKSDGTISSNVWYNDSLGGAVCTINPAPETDCEPESATGAREATLRAAVALLESSAFYSVGYTLNAAGEIASESESNGTVTRTRTWSSVTNPDGSTTFAASAWSYA